MERPHCSSAFSSNSDGTSTFLYKVDEGFYIDNLSVIKTTASLIAPLPVKFITVSAKALPNKTVSVNWEAIADQQHDHFEVERSEDGLQFINLGTVGTLPPYQFIDKAPRAGMNFYRIKQLDKGGKTGYSKVVSVWVDQAVQVALSPNPVKSQLTVKIHSSYPELYTLYVTYVTDGLGQVVHSQQMLISSSQEVSIPTYAWKAQVYMVELLNSKGEMVSTQKLVKL